MFRNTLSLLLCVAALCMAPAASGAASSSSFDYNYFIGTMNAKSWDGPYWWGLRTNILGLVVTHVEAQEVRSDRVGFSALSATFALLNVSRTPAGDKGLLLHAADTGAIPWEPTRACGKSEPPLEKWVVGEGARATALAPGQMTEVTVTLYLSEKARGSGSPVAQVALEVVTL